MRSGNPRAAVGYIRASKDEQQLSPAAQRAALERWCQAHGAELVAVHVEHLCSVTPVDKRPELLAALDALRAHGAGVLLVARRDRLARDPILTAMIERLVERAGAKVQSAAGEGSGDGPSEQLMRHIVDAFAQYERELIRQRTRAALGVKKHRGERVGTVPYGYRVGPDRVQLEPDGAEQSTIAIIVALRASGLSLRGVVRAAAARGLVSRCGRPFAETQIVNILKKENPCPDPRNPPTSAPRRTLGCASPQRTSSASTPWPSGAASCRGTR